LTVRLRQAAEATPTVELRHTGEAAPSAEVHHAAEAAPMVAIHPVADRASRAGLRRAGEAASPVDRPRAADATPPSGMHQAMPPVEIHQAADRAPQDELRPAAGRALPVELRTPSWVEVDAPPVHVPAAREISWRLRATAPNIGLCQISVAGETVTKELDARPAPRFSGTVRSTAWADALLHPAESRLPEGPVERIWISPVPAPLRFAGLTMEWWEWLAAIAGGTAWLLSILLARLRRPRLLHFLFHRL
jgi:hypothetical protein